MNLLQLSYFRVVARTGHMTKAAEELSIAQPSLSKTIGHLEKEIGVPLFDRQGRSIQLNRFGKAFLEHVETMFYELEEGQRKVRDMAGLEYGEVSLVSASIYWLPELLHSFQMLHPSVRFRLSQCPLSEMPQRLEGGTCDFCFLSTPLIKPGIQWKALLREEIILVVPPGHRLARQKIIPLQEVAQESVVIEKVGSGLRDLVDTFCQQAGFTLRIAYEIDEPAALYEFVKAHLGVAFVPALMKKQIHEQALLPLRLTDPICLRTFGIAWHQEHYLSEAARTFQQFIVEHFAALE
jgi:DNA-binding transcriptional LysR family regulator